MNKKGIVSVLVLLVLLFGTMAYADASGRFEDQAVILQDLGLLKGGSTGFDLLRAPKRVEAAVMLVRLLGKESEVLAGSYSHPFTDIPVWAINYIGYMYTNGLTKGKTSTLFGSNDLTDAKSYATFVLRALGFDDSKGDFSWGTALDFGIKNGILDQTESTRLNTVTFLRDDMVNISLNALSSKVKGSDVKLIDKLVAAGAVLQAKVDQTGLFEEPLYLRVKTDLINGKLVSTYDTSSLPENIRTRVTGIQNGSASNRINSYTTGELYFLCDDLALEFTFNVLPSIEHWSSPYATEFISIFVDHKLYGMTQIATPKVGTRDLKITQWKQEKYDQYVTPKINEINIMVKNARTISPSDFGWVRNDDNFTLFDLKGVIKELDVQYISMPSSNQPWSAEYLALSLLRAYGRDGTICSPHAKISQPELGISMSAQTGGTTPFDQGVIMTFFNAEKKLVAYSILNGSMPETSKSYQLHLSKHVPYSGDPMFGSSDIKNELLKMEISVQVGGKEIYRIAQGMFTAVGGVPKSINSSSSSGYDVNNKAAGIDAEIIITNNIFSPDQKPTAVFIGDSYGYSIDLK